ncbi:MAG: CoB--CoM heterodisulfide reductase iron-sulfur subunit B family protein [Desulfobaccales bacterium]
MKDMAQLLDVSYFPGCSLESSARESNLALLESAKLLGLNLIELEDWNCCGASSVKVLDKDTAFSLAARNLSLAPPDRPLTATCPVCLSRLREAQLRLKEDPEARQVQERHWRRQMPLDLEILSFLELLDRLGLERLQANVTHPLKGLKAVPYYGCTTFGPPELNRGRYFLGELEGLLAALGAEPLTKALTHRCCGGYLTVARADAVTPLVNEIMESAVAAGAECLVTSCPMCQLNLESRCTLPNKLPVLHFSEVLALALGARDYDGWFARHLIDPRPLLKARGLIS